MSYRLAKSLETLRTQINQLFPERSRVSDGWIGNAEHASRESDHNPWVKDSKGVGVVTAIDITLDKDPSDGEGVDCQKLADCLVKNRDPRIKYIIWNRQICSSRQKPWQWRPYTGKNAHKHHLHISVDASEIRFDDARRWNLTGLQPVSKPLVSADTPGVAESKAVNPKTAVFQPSVASAENSPDLAAGGNSADNSKAVERTESETIETPEGQKRQESTLVNQQNVEDKVPIEQPKPQGLKAKLSAGIGTLVGGTLLYTFLEKLGTMSFSMQSIVLIAVVCFFALLGFMFWAFMDAWKANNKITHERESKTAIDKKDLEWVKPAQS